MVVVVKKFSVNVPALSDPVKHGIMQDSRLLSRDKSAKISHCFRQFKIKIRDSETWEKIGYRILKIAFFNYFTNFV